MRNEHFCDFEQKYTPETITFIRFWATFPQAWFFIMISFCRKEIFFAEFYFPDSFFQFSGKFMFLRKKSSKNAYLFLRLEHDPSPFCRQGHIGNVFFRILFQKVEIIPFWLPNRKIIKIPHFWSKNDISAPMAPTLINVTVSLVFWDSFSSFSDFGGKIPQLKRKNHFLR